MGPLSRVDKIYRRFALGRFFAGGWGDPKVMDALYANRSWFSHRESFLEKPTNILKEAEGINLSEYPMSFGSRRKEKGVYMSDGFFEAPMYKLFPEITPACLRKARVKLIEPLNPSNTGFEYDDGNRPFFVHLAGTGDHGFWRRSKFMARPLANERGITSLLLENPFYGSRKPADQLRSSLRYVTDLYIMGACLILESFVLLQWAKRQGFAPLGLTGISMGGYMACLGAAVYPEPLMLVPCMSASTASIVYTTGVMGQSIPWTRLAEHMDDCPTYRQHLNPFYAGIRATEQGGGAGDGNRFDDNSPPRIDTENELESDRSIPSQRAAQNSQSVGSTDAGWFKKTEQHAFNAMTGIMDDFTYLKNYSTPVDPSLVTNVTAEHDAYVPGASVPKISDLWPGSKVITVPGGHVLTYLTGHGVFRKAIYETLDRTLLKYYNREQLQQQQPLNLTNAILTDHITTVHASNASQGQISVRT